MKTKIYKYHVSNSFVTKEGEKVSMLTQLYKVGVYAIVNNDSGMQMNLRPQDLVKIEKDLNKQILSGEITDLQFGREISVTDETGLWQEVEN